MGSFMRMVLLWPLVLGPLVAGEDAGKPVMNTQYGKLRGITVTVKESDRPVHAFYGIPFAKPPIGPLRFAAPEPPEPWTTVREATDYPSVCVQSPHKLHLMLKAFSSDPPTLPISEDCLYLSVFTPANREKNYKLPVMVFIHGGGLRMGGSVMFEGSALAAYENVVVVSIQYRLGLLGFLSTEDGQAAGNFGFLDQVAALRWVQDNIKDFGGDPHLVTIFGVSAGGVSVSALVLSPLARGLFHRAIAESGTAIIPYLMTCKSEDLSITQNSVAEVSACDPSSLIDCLRKKSEDEIKAISTSLAPMKTLGNVDGEFLPRCAEEILAQKDVAHVPFMTGVNNHEFGWSLSKELKFSGLLEGMDKAYVRWALRNILLLEVSSNAIPLVMDEYFGDVEDPLEIRDRFLELCSDLAFTVPALRTANLHRDSGLPVYFYEFQHRPSLYKGIKPDYVKADHSDEVFFVVGGPFLKDGLLFSGPDTEEEKSLSRTVMKYWANFARHGDPNGPGLARWPQYDQSEEYLQINLQQQSARKLRAEKLEFWTETLSRKLRKGNEDERPLLATRYGKLHGKTMRAKGAERAVHAFYRVPFAKPPVGALRFAVPEDPEGWNGVREATEQPDMCLQSKEMMDNILQTLKVNITVPPTSEDCLYLNVFTPADRQQDTKLPVMVFIHGGGLFMGGAMMFEGSALSAYENVVVVSIQYRLGIPGFFSSGDSRAPGNYGFLDQVQSLRWVRETIADFGGDPHCVTIFGESAGGISVAALVLSPLAKGLFQRAIAESGVALMPGLVTKSVEESNFVRNVIANISGCDMASLVDCMKAKSEEEILSLSTALAMKFMSPPATIDGAFFPKPAEQILEAKENNPVAFMTGVSEQEFGWILPAAMNISGLAEGMDRETVRAALQSNPFLGKMGPVIPLLEDEYIGDETDPAEIRNRFLDLCGDFTFVMPALKTAKYHRDSGYPVYVYEFRHRPAMFKDTKPDFVKADHGDEIFFVIGGPFLMEGKLFAGETNEDEKILSKTLMKYWGNFARTGDPNGPGLTEWPRYDEDEDYLQIEIQQKAAQRLKDAKYKFWTETLPDEIQKLSAEGSEHSEL